MNFLPPTPPSTLRNPSGKNLLGMTLLVAAMAGCGGGGSSATTAPATPAAPVPGISLVAGSITENATVDGASATARFDGTTALALDSGGNLYVATSSRIRKISAAGMVSTLAGGGNSYDPAETAPDKASISPNGVAVDTGGNVYFAASQYIRRLPPQGVLSTVVTAPFGLYNDGRSAAAVYFTGVAVDGSGNIFASNDLGIRKVSPAGTTTILAGVDKQDFLLGTRLINYNGLAIDTSGNLYARRSGILKFNAQGIPATVAGQTNVAGLLDGTGALATVDYGGHIAVDGAGNVYLAETTGNLVRKVTPAGVVTTVAGTRGGTTVDISKLPGVLPPIRGIAVTPAGVIYIGAGNAILKIVLP